MVLPPRGQTPDYVRVYPISHPRSWIKSCASTCVLTQTGDARSPGLRALGGAPPGGGRFSTLLSLSALGGRYVPRARCPRLHLPAPLCSSGITRAPRYYGCSDSCWPTLSVSVREGRSDRPAGLPASRCRTFGPFRLQAPLAAPEVWSGSSVRAYRVSPPGLAEHPRSSGSERHLGFAFS